MTGQIIFLSVPVLDVARAAAFYATVLSWETTTDASSSTPAAPNGVLSTHPFQKGMLRGAFLRVADPAGLVDVAGASSDSSKTRLVPICTFAVDSVAEALRRVEAAGGRVHIPRTDLGEGRGAFARFVDSEGNLQAIWSKN
ncbi:uncharacterized protein E0L32_000122 [Thyridium curvatum]|uniref:Glyoxalase/fosfomycin resistance/dioxygenase domain-containing protein n=1 Tax=Thyridium curvatum TaxID=1093900 RepID=A0A507BGF4_9PEZI|nr:uncharacterized protein E0L32_000122 [Thyridium curvatum]TPX15788.1 hypothetical protein E0L32_000122 [Thyridium curvatum]